MPAKIRVSVCAPDGKDIAFDEGREILVKLTPNGHLQVSAAHEMGFDLLRLTRNEWKLLLHAVKSYVARGDLSGFK